MPFWPSGFSDCCIINTNLNWGKCGLHAWNAMDSLVTLLMYSWSNFSSQSTPCNVPHCSMFFHLCIISLSKAHWSSKAWNGFLKLLRLKDDDQWLFLIWFRIPNPELLGIIICFWVILFCSIISDKIQLNCFFVVWVWLVELTLLLKKVVLISYFQFQIWEITF